MPITRAQVEELRVLALRLASIASELGRTAAGETEDGAESETGDSPPHPGYVRVGGHEVVGAPLHPPTSSILVPDAWPYKKGLMLRYIRLYWEQFGEPVPSGALKKWVGPYEWAGNGMLDRMLYEMEESGELVTRVVNRRCLVIFEGARWESLGPDGRARFDEKACRVSWQATKSVSPERLGHRLRQLKRRRKLDERSRERRLRFKDGRRKAELAGFFLPGGEKEKIDHKRIELSSESMLRAGKLREQINEVIFDGEKTRDWVRNDGTGRPEGDRLTGGQGGAENGPCAPMVSGGGAGGGQAVGAGPVEEDSGEGEGT